MAKLIALLAVLLLVSGCAQKAQIALDATVAVSPEFTPSETEAVLSALEAWKTETKGRVDLKVSVGVQGDLVIKPAGRPGYRGWTDVEGSKAVMQIDLGNVGADRLAPVVGLSAELKDTVMHELGHALGLEHQDGTLMRPVGFAGGAVDKETLEQFEAVRGLLIRPLG